MTRIYSKISATWDDHVRRYIVVQSTWQEYSGPLALVCGATREQKNLEAQQSAYYAQLRSQQESIFQQQQQVFGKASAIFDELRDTFSPVLRAGVNQEGFTQAEKDLYNRQITEQTGTAYKHAADALNAQIASEGGGNVPIISSQDNSLRAGLVQSEASMESAQREGVEAESRALGRENFYRAAGILGNAGSAFNPAIGMSGASTGAANAATGAGSAAAQTANQIAEANNSWVNATIGALGDIAGGAAKGWASRSKATEPAMPPVPMWGGGYW